LFSLGFCIAGVASLFSAVDRYRWRTVGLSMAFVVLQIVINLFGVALKNDTLKACSLITAYEPQKLVELACNRPQYAWTFMFLQDNVWMWGTFTHCAVLLAFGLLSYVLALVIFVRRDLPAPL
jgi:ABC-2 type transport system permease protein